jgi:hypothetical protein
VRQTKHSIHWAPVTIYVGGGAKWPELETKHSTQSNVEVNIYCSIHTHFYGSISYEFRFSLSVLLVSVLIVKHVVQLNVNVGFLEPKIFMF